MNAWEYHCCQASQRSCQSAAVLAAGDEGHAKLPGERVITISGLIPSDFIESSAVFSWIEFVPSVVPVV